MVDAAAGRLTANRVYHPRISQRAHEAGGRPPAIRALVLYPLNALAEDQMSTASPGAGQRPGARAGSAPTARGTGSGSDDIRAGRRYPGSPQRDSAEAELRTELRRQSSLATRVAGTDAQRFFPRFDGGEMWSRWDMQDAPPDILITNYSMLNIMLMRDIEDQIFAATRRWLEDPANVFPSRRRRTAYLPRNARNGGRIHPSGPLRAAWLASRPSAAADPRVERLARRRRRTRPGLSAPVLRPLAALHAHSRWR